MKPRNVGFEIITKATGKPATHITANIYAKSTIGKRNHTLYLIWH